MFHKSARFLCLSIVALLLSACASPPNARYTVESVRTQFNSEIPLGSDVAFVEKYLIDKGFGKSDFIDNATMAHMGRDPQTVELINIIRNTRRSLFVSTSITMVFTFTRDQKLTNIKVEEVHTGL